MDDQYHGDPTTGFDTGSSSKRTDPEIFTRHNDSVLCCSIDKNTRLAVTGGIDDTAFVWDLNTKHVIFECLGHKESVVAADFSCHSAYVATADLNGYIQVRNTTTGIKVFDFEIDEINWVKWHNSSEYVLLAGTIKGDFWMWNVNDPVAVKTFPSFGSSSSVAMIMPDGLRIIVAYQDGSIRLLDLKSGQTILHHQDNLKSEIISMDLNSKQTTLAVGCLDSSVKLLTINNMKVIGSMSCKTPEQFKNLQSVEESSGPSTSEAARGEPMDQDAKNESTDGDDDIKEECIPEAVEVIDEYTNFRRDDIEQDQEEDNDVEDDAEDEDLEDDKNGLESVETVLFSPCGSFLAAANNSGTIVIWDVSTQTKRNEVHTGVGITTSAWTCDGNYVVGNLDGELRIYDNNLVEKRKIVAHNDQILDMELRNDVIVTASEDKTARVIKF